LDEDLLGTDTMPRPGVSPGHITGPPRPPNDLVGCDRRSVTIARPRDQPLQRLRVPVVAPALRKLGPGDVPHEHDVAVVLQRRGKQPKVLGEIPSASMTARIDH
jgi:hypothetical protein